VAIVGGGAFGRGVAGAIARGVEPGEASVLLWSRTLGDQGPSVEVVRELSAVAERELIFLAVPSTHAPSVLSLLGQELDGRHLVVHVSRGLLEQGVRPLSEAVRERTPCRRIGALAGPLSAEALLGGRSAGAVVGSDFPEVVAAVAGRLASPSIVIDGSEDLLGVELASALTGMLLVAIGLAQGLRMGPCSVGILATHGIAEGARVGASLGARPETFHGLACSGDLVAAIAGDPRPEIAVGRELSRGRSVESLGGVVDEFIEGISVAQDVATYCRRANLDAPIILAMADLLSGSASLERTCESLFGAARQA
jgi:glycerol-3-phosphate dehydrogenase (NAD(P)+)